MEEPTIPRATLLSELASHPLPERAWARFGRLFLEAFLLMTFTLCLPLFMGLKQSGIIALFLVAAVMMERFQGLMDENRDNIWVHQRGGWQSNLLSATSLLAIFLGLLLANGGFAFVLFTFAKGVSAKAVFGPILQVVQGDVAVSHRFSSLLGILANNYAVLLTTVMITLLFRVYGMILVLSWNACVWGVVLVYLLRQSFVMTKASVWVYSLQSMVAVFPHVALEASSYILGGLAGVFLSKGLTAYKLSDPRFRQVAKAVLWLLVLAALFVLLGGVAEVWIAPRLLP